MKLSLCCFHGKQWLQRQAKDKFVCASRRDGYVARSAYKLLAIDDQYGILRSAAPSPSCRDVRSSSSPQRVLDLGCSPGSWCQVLRERCGDECQIWALDLLPVRASLRNVTYIQGDFTDVSTQQTLLSLIRDQNEVPGPAIGTEGVLDLVTSDMCPNRMGGTSDRQRQAALQLQALHFSLPLLQTGGHFVCKLLGPLQGDLKHVMGRWFQRVSIMKPLASRAASDEVFAIGRSKLHIPCSPSIGAAGQRHFGLDDWPGFTRLPRPRRH